jgi:hypothetical protein
MTELTAITPVQLDCMASAGFDLDTYTQLCAAVGDETPRDLFLNVHPASDGRYWREDMARLNKRLYSEIALLAITSRETPAYHHVQREWRGVPRCLGVLTGDKLDAAPVRSRIEALTAGAPDGVA